MNEILWGFSVGMIMVAILIFSQNPTIVEYIRGINDKSVLFKDLFPIVFFLVWFKVILNRSKLFELEKRIKELEKNKK